MIAPAFAGAEDQLWQWAMAMIRPGAALIAAPIFGAQQVPLPLRIILALMIGIAATGPAGATMPTFSCWLHSFSPLSRSRM